MWCVFVLDTLHEIARDLRHVSQHLALLLFGELHSLASSRLEAVVTQSLHNEANNTNTKQ